MGAWAYGVRDDTTAARFTASIEMILGDVDHFGGVGRIDYVPVSETPNPDLSRLVIALRGGRQFEITVRDVTDKDIRRLIEASKPQGGG